MTPSSSEQKIRLILPLVRFLQVCMPLPVSRWLLPVGLRRVRLEAGVKREAVSAGGVPCEWLIPRNDPQGRVLLYLHGGGFVYGVTPPHLQMVAYLAQKMDVRVLMVDYRLAPQHPYPAALEDCVTAYRWLLKQGFLPQNIAVAGDSAGGNLTITLMMKLRADGDPLPAAAACLSPVADFSGKARAQAGFKDPLLPARSAKFYNQAYLAGHDPRDPLVSPVFGDWTGLPPLLVHAGEQEILRLDALRIQELAGAAGLDVRLEIYPRMWHVWQIFLSLPQAIQSLDDVACFLGSHLGQDSPC